MIPHEILNTRLQSDCLPPPDFTMERDILHSYSLQEEKNIENATLRRERIKYSERLVEQQIEREIQEKKQQEILQREKEKEEMRLHLEFERQEKLRRETEQRKMEELKRKEQQEILRLEQLKREQQIQEARRIQMQREREERELLELKRQQAEEQARVEALRKQREAQEAKRREELEQRRKEQEFVEQLLLFEKQKETAVSPPPYRPPNNEAPSSPPSNYLLDLDLPNSRTTDPFIQPFVDQGMEEDVVIQAINICGKNPQQVTGYLSEYRYYVQCGFPKAKIFQGLRLFGADRAKCFQFFTSSTQNFLDEQVFEAMNYFQMDIDKAVKFLEGLNQLKEMGLEGTRAKQALISCNNDANAAAALLFDSPM
eukprot:CAMPEP_0117073170 /NCGR_PEP_ID=MMETSP0472-20121206/51531_1 /TAXON_ID=693140 ORGANISM="Tiarina fusus, Strain LIS" /NCGR_SAMPLE_ID=MMETSP0472 /ASSEMBLY_ACC=CAM_ASM_000603 /LENGTH=369 /DNA_ID=CAMNT_0004797633 /DNA_START=600 /DNA_END=1709 /DNA_ORIENTATION=-